MQLQRYFNSTPVVLLYQVLPCKKNVAWCSTVIQLLHPLYNCCVYAAAAPVTPLLYAMLTTV